MAAKVLARYKQKENATPYPLFTPVDNAFYYVQRSLMETAEGIKTSYDQYELEFQETLHLARTAHMLNHDKSIVNAQSLRIYRAAFLMVSVVSVATIVAGLIFGFILGVANYRSYVRPTQRNTACNMGGIVLISNAGLMWATCAFIPVLLTFCFPLAAMLEAYVCEPYDEQDGTSLDGNGLWLSLVCCLLSMLAAIPVTLMISRYFLRMHRYMVDGQAPDDEVRGDLEARMKQEKHLKRIKEVREHILQQSREARCLVMSFDTLEAPPALPAVSVDSGSHDLARIIPTSVVRRVGVDDPKLPRGKESPFRQMIVPKPPGV
ncbi:hypothetical protein HPB52_004710 [Rhipicephalus sanguineus]|uniref:Uncharacterized protein n=1 Tax=Rhipicephalus sanguineus TaxID=34632 RepID=A0A9D4PRN0_RHISA|nr:hypothetical protein HPB52_004710 [Rhipicephalus sanguineus]